MPVTDETPNASTEGSERLLAFRLGTRADRRRAHRGGGRGLLLHERTAGRRPLLVLSPARRDARQTDMTTTVLIATHSNDKDSVIVRRALRAMGANAFAWNVDLFGTGQQGSWSNFDGLGARIMP